MERLQLKIGSRFLFVLLLTALVQLGSTTKVNASGELGTVASQRGIDTTTTASPFQRKVGKVAIVAQSGGDYTNPVTAMANVSTWCGTPSATNPCLVKIMPGVYDLNGGSLTMQAYVDIEGSGETITIITSAFTYDRMPEPLGVVNGADNAELRFLTVQDYTPGPLFKIAISNNGQSPKITHVTAIAGNFSGIMSMSASPLFTGGSTGVFNYNSSPTMSDVTVKATGGYGNYGIHNENSSPTMSNVIVTAVGGDKSTGIFNYNSSPTMNNVTVKATGGGSANIALENSSTYAATILIERSTIECGPGSSEADSAVSNGGNVTLKIGGSKLIGTIVNSGTITCAGSYNGDYVALGSNCQ